MFSINFSVVNFAFKVKLSYLIFLGTINIELTIKSMQRQLLQIADKIPDNITLTLLKAFAQILSRESEPAPKTPFIRAFAKICDDTIEKQFSSIAEENEDQLNDYESEKLENDNECTFNYKITTSTEEIVYSKTDNDVKNGQQLELIQAEIEVDSPQREFEATKVENINDEIFEKVEEDIALEMPEINGVENMNNETYENIEEDVALKMPELLPVLENQEDEIIFAEYKNIENISMSKNTEKNECNHNLENEIPKDSTTELKEQSEEEENFLKESSIPTEIPKVSLDDIEREIQEMQMFLLRKGVEPNKKNKFDNGNTKDADLEDAYSLDVCIPLKNRNGDSQKKHHHSKYMRSENYKEEVVQDGPIFDPSVPNTLEGFMKVKSVPEKIHRKKQKVQPLDVSWQNLCENQKKLYK